MQVGYGAARVEVFEYEVCGIAQKSAHYSMCTPARGAWARTATALDRQLTARCTPTPIPGGRRAAARDALALQVPPRQGAATRASSAPTMARNPTHGLRMPPRAASPSGRMPVSTRTPNPVFGPACCYLTALTSNTRHTSCSFPNPSPRSGPRPCPPTWWTTCAPQAHTPPQHASPPPRWRHAAARIRRARRGAAGHGTVCYTGRNGLSAAGSTQRALVAACPQAY